MCEPIMSVPWLCDDKQCDHTWHLGTYWIDASSEEGYTYDEFTDGDHVEVSEDDLPTQRDFSQSWLDYHRYVLRTGSDPLGEFCIKHEIRKTVRYQARIASWVGGVEMTQIRRASQPWQAKRPDIAHLSDVLIQFLNLELRGDHLTLLDFESLEHFREVISGKHSNVRVMRNPGKSSKAPAPFDTQIEFEVTESTPRKDSAIRRDLVARAKEAVANDMRDLALLNGEETSNTREVQINA